MKAVIYRIVGNALPERHGPSDVLDQTRYILENEPAFPSCGKRWILNRIVDPAAKAELIALLDAHGAVYEDIPFDAKAYYASFYDAAGLPPERIPPLAGSRRGRCRTWPTCGSEGIAPST